MFTLTATDHREGAYGDLVTIACDTLDACHEWANTFDCGIYTTDDGTTVTTWESDGTTVVAIDTADTVRTVYHYFSTESDANTARALFIEDGYSCTPVTRSVTGSYMVGVTVTWAHGAV